MKSLLFIVLCYFQMFVIQRSIAQASEQQGFLEEIRSKQLYPYFKTDTLEQYAEDFGRIIHKTPMGVFAPHTIENLQQFLPIANTFNVKVTCRGKGNSVYGHSQTKGGVIIDLSNLQLQPPIRYAEDLLSVTVLACKTWFELIEFTKENNMTVPVTIDSLDLTVGGTLSFGAIGGTSYRYGSGADNVSDLDIITMDGKLYKCSKTENSELFNATLCGIGQFGIIIYATILLVPAKKKVNIYKLSYDNLDKFLTEQKDLYTSKVFDHLKGYAKKNNGVWEYVIEAASYFDDKEETNVAKELKKLFPHTKVIETKAYFDFINIVTKFVNTLKENEKLNVPHPWYNVLLPENAIKEHLALALDTPYLTGTEPIIIYPLDSNKFKRPLFMKPNSSVFYLLGVLYNTSFSAIENYPFQEVLKRNMELYQTAKKEGGCRYPVDAIPFIKKDWQEHYGNKWASICLLKQKYDPKNILTIGVSIFD